MIIILSSIEKRESYSDNSGDYFAHSSGTRFSSLGYTAKDMIAKKIDQGYFVKLECDVASTQECADFTNQLNLPGLNVDYLIEQ